MTPKSVSEEVLEALRRLGDTQQRRVVEYAQSLSDFPHEASPAEDLTAFAGAWSEAEASEIAAAIEEGCERTNLDAW